VKRPHHAAVVEQLAPRELHAVTRGARFADAGRVRLRRFDELHAADASVARADLSPPFGEEQLGDAGSDAPQVLAVEIAGRRMLEAHMAMCAAPPLQPVDAEYLKSIAWSPDDAA